MSQVAPGASQAIVVIAPSATALTVTVAYPGRGPETFHGAAGPDGVYRIQFKIPIDARPGLAHVHVVTPGAAADDSFAIS